MRLRIPAGVGVVLASGLAGLAVFGYLAIASRAMTPEGSDRFSVFWSLALVIGFAGFQPLEAELARTLAHREDTAAALREGAVVAAGVAGAVVVLLAAAAVPIAGLVGGDLGLVAAAAGVAAVSALQFFVRGALLGRGEAGAFAGTIVADSVLRVVLAAAVWAVVARPSASGFALTLVAALGLGHALFLPRALRGASRGPVGTARPLALARRISPLFAASVCGQLLLNAPVLVIAALTVPGEASTAAFTWAFTLARVPLFMAVPVQGALVPPMAAMVAGGRLDRLVRLLVTVTALVAAVGAVGGALAAWLGPEVLQLLFTDRYAVPGGDLALMVVGVAAHIGLLVAAQANLAAGHHRGSALAWSLGLAVAVAVFAAGPALPGGALAGPFARVEWAFALGSGAGWVVAMVLLVRHARLERTRS